MYPNAHKKIKTIASFVLGPFNTLLFMKFGNILLPFKDIFIYYIL